jgi:GGDEF domain-containing protein
MPTQDELLARIVELEGRNERLDYLLTGSFNLAKALEGIRPDLGLDQTVDEITRICGMEFGGQAEYVEPEAERLLVESSQKSFFEEPSKPIPLDEVLRSASRESHFYRVEREVVVPLSHNQGALLLHNITPDFAELEDPEMDKVLTYLSLWTGNRLIERKAKESALRKASVDHLTGLLTRGAFEEVYTQLFEEARREEVPLSLIMGDLDNFKGLNDTYGHPHGDSALRALGLALTDSLRSQDLQYTARGRTEKRNGNSVIDFLDEKRAARFGGEEFIIPLKGVSPERAIQIAERIRRTIAGLNIGYAEPILSEPTEGKKLYHLPPNQIQASLGIATFPNNADNTTLLLEYADRALYVAKAEGRNRAVSFMQGMRKTD